MLDVVPLYYIIPHPNLFVIGVEPSLCSVKVNKKVKLKICGDATQLPLPANSVDSIVCFYSIHHMVGATKEETKQIVRKALSEFARVLQPGGSIYIFEMRPWPLFSLMQFLFWNLARKLYPHILDMYFWSQRKIQVEAQLAMPKEMKFSVKTFKTAWFCWFSPMFSLPWVKAPRFIYPFSPVLYRWDKSLD